MFSWLKRKRPAAAQTSRPRDDELARWAAAQLMPWQTSGLHSAALDTQFAAWNTEYADIYVFDFAAGHVDLREKPVATNAPNRAEYARRASLYHDFFQAVLDRSGLKPVGALAMTLEDYRLGPPPAPLGAFQRRASEHYLLFPDVDALTKDFFQSEPADPHEFSAKRDKAIFAGSTTGGEHTVASVAQLHTQRLASGVFFRGSDDVYFRLPTIVQCVDAAAEQAIRDLGFGTGRADWAEHLTYKFLISIDGNGATCSRVALALRSNSALLKYRSDHELYYFPGLRDGENYLAIARDEDVLAIIRNERARPGCNARVAPGGTAFFDAYLTRTPAILYTAALLRAYFALFYPATEPAAALPDEGFPLAATLHIAGIGDRVTDPATWVGVLGHPIEGFAIGAKEFFAPFTLEYSAFGADGPTPWQASGGFVGTRGQNQPLLGFAIRLSRGGETRRAVYYGRFGNGELVGPIQDGAPCLSAQATPLEGLRVAIEDRRGRSR